MLVSDKQARSLLGECSLSIDIQLFHEYMRVKTLEEAFNDGGRGPTGDDVARLACHPLMGELLDGLWRLDWASFNVINIWEYAAQFLKEDYVRLDGRSRRLAPVEATVLIAGVDGRRLCEWCGRVGGGSP